MSRQELGQEMGSLRLFVEEQVLTTIQSYILHARDIIYTIRNNPTRLGLWETILSKHHNLELALECGPLSNREQAELTDLTALAQIAFGVHAHRVFTAYDEMVNRQITSMPGV